MAEGDVKKAWRAWILVKPLAVVRQVETNFCLSKILIVYRALAFSGESAADARSDSSKTETEV